MKKAYVSPVAEKIEFNYREQVVAASRCGTVYINEDPNSGGACINSEPFQQQN